MEDLHLEFEMKAETSEKLKPFLADVTERLATMASFKKTFLKFQFSVEASLKKVVVATCFL